jgi:hypothetical protein
MNHNPRAANSFVALISAAGLFSVGYALTRATTWHPWEASVLLAIAVATSRMKVRLPGLTSTMSVNLPFVLIAAMQLSLLEALLIALASTAVQSVPKGGKPKAIQMLFNMSTMAVALGAGHWILQQASWASASLLVSLAAASFFLVQTAPVAAVIALTEGGKMSRIWSSIFHLSFPYYVLSAGVTSLVTTASHRIGWQIPLLALPVMYGVSRSYRLYFGGSAEAPQSMALAKSAGAGC